jgi:hypothetical protein
MEHIMLSKAFVNVAYSPRYIGYVSFMFQYHNEVY